MRRSICFRVQLSTIQGYMSKFYRRYGTWVARNPFLVLCLSLAVVILLSLGSFRFKVETRPEKLWVGHGSIALQEKEFFDGHLAPFYRIEQVDGIQANYSGSLVCLTDICMKPLGQDCATQSVLQYFKMNPANYDGYGGIQHVLYCFQHNSSVDTCRSAFKAPLDPSTVLGGFLGNSYTEASAFIVTYPINNAINKEDNESEIAVAWEKTFIHLAKDELLPMVQSITLASLSEVLAFAVGGLIPMPACRVFSMLAGLIAFLVSKDLVPMLILIKIYEVEVRVNLDCSPGI